MGKRRLRPAIELVSGIGSLGFDLQHHSEADITEAVRVLRTVNPDMFTWLVNTLANGYGLVLAPDDVERIKIAVRTLDCGVHYCRYCNATSSTGWEHRENCAYVTSVRDASTARSILAGEK